MTVNDDGPSSYVTHGATVPDLKVCADRSRLAINDWLSGDRRQPGDDLSSLYDFLATAKDYLRHAEAETARDWAELVKPDA
jgi:hypothetical protein